MGSATKFKILAFNANSIGKNPKRRKVLLHLNKKNPDFILISDTRICKTIEQTVREEWGGKCLFNSFSSQARGVAIFLKKDNTAAILDKYCDNTGNMIALLINYEGKRILLECIYGPNTDSPDFYSEKVFKKINEWQPDFSILAGDFNIALDPSKDTKNYIHDNNPNAREALKAKIEQNNMFDIWRELHTDESTFTWHKFNENKQSRLDYFLVSASLRPFVVKADIIPGFCSDHSAITLELDFSKFIRGRGFWKFNSSLLYDNEYVMGIKKLIKRVVAQYAIIDDNSKFYETVSNEVLKQFYDSATPESLQYVNLRINPQAFLDILQLEIRGFSISYSSKKKRERIAQEVLLLQEIEILEKKVAECTDDINFDNMNQVLSNKKEELENVYAYQAQGAYIRAKAKYKVEGEKPSRLFCSLEKHNGVQKHIPKLIIEKNGVKAELTEQKKIESEIHDYYKDLFSNKDKSNQEISNFLDQDLSNSCPKISDLQKDKMNGLITEEELTRYIKKSKNNVSPGSSGFTNDFYKFFWIDLKRFITKAINFSYENKMFSVTQRMGIITLIPKGDKDKTYLKNWRPLTLLNTIYKLVSGCVAERIKPHLDTIIHGDQKGFVSGRYIGEAIKTTYDIIEWAKVNKKSGILLLIDFEKAYDSLSFKYIKKCLNFFNFSEYIINWVDILLNNFSAVINHCGNISNKFNISRGARQGDPLASYLFIICIEILAHKLRSDKLIKKFKLENLAHTLELYADDCTIFLEPEEFTLKRTIQTLDDFFQLSGLKISVTKTKAIRFGFVPPNIQQLCPDLQLDWDTHFKLLGIDFSNNLIGMECNYESKVKEIKQVFNSWMNRTLTVYGKSVVIKTLALPKLTHLALVLPNLDKMKIKQLESLIFTFLWGNKPDKVNREDAKLSEKAGGLGIVDVNSFWKSLKFSWLRRAVCTNAFWPQILCLSVKPILGHEPTITELLQLGPKMLNNIGKKMSNHFWREVFSSVILFMQGALFCFPEKIFSAPFWDNPNVLQNNKAVKKTSFPTISSKISTISDFFIPGTCQLFTKEEFETRYDIEISDDNFTELKYIIKISYRNLGLRDDHNICTFLPSQPLLLAILNLTKTGCSAYNRLLNKKSNLHRIQPKSENKWHMELGRSYGIDFWLKTYSLAASIKNDNKLRWFQYQINRNSLFTNYRVNKFKNHISPLCSFCSHLVGAPQSNELISHIFFECDFVLQLWQQVRGWLGGFNIGLELNRTILLFGIHSENSQSIKNFIILTVKYYIWRSKFQNIALTLNGYQDFLKNKLDDHKNACFYQGKEIYFEPWIVIYNCLERICIGTRMAPLPDTADPQAQAQITPSPPGSPTGPQIT